MARQNTKYRHITADNKVLKVKKEVTPEGVKYFIAGTNERAEGRMVRDKFILDTPQKVKNYERHYGPAKPNSNKWQDYAHTSADT